MAGVEGEVGNKGRHCKEGRAGKDSGGRVRWNRKMRRDRNWERVEEGRGKIVGEIGVTEDCSREEWTVNCGGR